MDLLTFYILLIIFVATLIRSTFGFGESLTAVPLLSLFIPIEEAVPFSVLVSILIAGIVVVKDRKKIHLNSVKWLIVYAIIGIPIGLYLLATGDENIVKIILGALLIIYSLYSLFSRSSFKLESDNKLWLFICGFLSGIFGGAYGLNGPPLVIYGNLRRWNAQYFRATLQAYFLPVSLVAMIGYWYQGLWNASVTHYFLISIPVVIPTVFLGRYFNHRLNDRTFLKFIYIGLIVIGTVLVLQSLLT